MRIKVGECYVAACGEVFGPMKDSGSAYAHPFFVEKLGSVHTFHENGRYNNDGRKPHILDLVAVAR